MDTRDVIARFEADRQALAMMEHPNVAHVLDGGATESGRPDEGFGGPAIGIDFSPPNQVESLPFRGPDLFLFFPQGGCVTMLPRVLNILVVCFFNAAIAAADDKTANDTKELQGVWQAVSLEANGEARPDDEAKELQIVFKGDAVFAVKAKREEPHLKFKLDARKTPKTIDLIPIDGSDKGKTAAGIYSLKDGRLRVCINIFGQDTSQRPKEFKTQAGHGVVAGTFERAKQK
jgi:uncharacterized protein (TIGR03067 family)